MSRIRSTIWDIEPHTQAKHEILKRYLQAWFPILARWHGRIIYLDGFAGPGIYSHGERGSPVIAINTALEHTQRKSFRAEIIFKFIEKDIERAKILVKVLKDQFPNLPDKMEYEVIGSEFAPTLEQVLDHLDEQQLNLAPTFAFLDPFGFSGLPMELIARLLRHKSCEVLVTFMAGFVNRFLVMRQEKSLDELFGTPKWRDFISDSPNDASSLKLDRQREIINLYEECLQEIGGVKYVRSFEMRNKDNKLIYCLVFGTCHLKGLKVMKDAMWKVDPRGQYSFSDVTGHQQTYITKYTAEKFWVPRAAKLVYQEFQGKTVKVEDVEEFVLAKTPYRFQKIILRYLENQRPSLIRMVSKSDGSRRRRSTFPDGCSITFSP